MTYCRIKTLVALVAATITALTFYAAAQDINPPEAAGELPKVLIIGDSISGGYTPRVVKTLKGKALVKHNPGNAQHTGTGIKKLDAWIGKTDWDVIHFNWGLWDLCYRHPESKVQGRRDKVRGKLTTPIDLYEKNLDQLVTRLQKTKAVLIWANTTVVPEGEAGRKLGDDARNNAAAARVMKKHGVPVNDLHTLTKGFGPELFSKPGDVHFNAEGYEKIAQQVAFAIEAAITGDNFNTAVAIKKPLKVYILAGQSNMQGSAHKRTFAAMGNDPKTAKLLNEILDQNGEPSVCDNAWITYLTGSRDGDSVKHGKVKVGYGFDEERIGPEYGFGIYIDKALDEPVLIIKTAWGGKSLAVDFRPPSAGPYVPSANEKERGNVPSEDKVGHYYRQMNRFIQATLKDTESIRKVVPGYDEQQGYELAGFVWFQGWNDMCNRHHIEQYTENMIHFIRDVRQEFDTPTLPFIVGILGVYGTDPDSRKFDKGLPVTLFRKAQFAAVEQYNQKVEPRYRGKVIAVDSGPYYELELSDIYWKRRLTGHWKRRVKQGEMTPEKYKEECLRHGFGDGELTTEEQSTWDRCSSNAEYHYLGSGKTFIRFGKALAEAMLEMRQK